MTVGFFSPLPPARTGVADYAAALLRALAPLGSVKVNAADADVCLYHLGNNHLHRDIYERALQRPGIAVIHDAVLHHFFLGALSESEYVEEFCYNYGDWTADLARSLWNGRARSATDPRYFRYPMLKRIAERSLALVVHNPAASAMVRAHAPGALVHEIPHLFDPPAPPPSYEVERLRATLGCNGQTLLCAVFGHLRESKRLLSVVRAFEKVSRRRPVRLLVAGEFASSDLKRAVEPLLATHGIARRGYLSDAEFWTYAAATDVCVNLRYPPAGETSGIAIRLMGIGKPVILTAGVETAGFPETACLRIDAGEAEEDMLAANLEWLADNPQDAREMGRRAADHIRREHAIGRVAEAYWRVLRRCYDTGEGLSAQAQS